MSYGFISIFRMGFLCGIFWLSIGACQTFSRQNPDWVFGLPHEQFPAAEYLTGIATGDNQENARKNAIVDFFDRLNASIQNNLPFTLDSTHFAASWFHPEMHQPDLSQLTPELSASWRDRYGKVHAALVTMKRLSAEKYVIGRIGEFDSSCIREARTGEQAFSVDNKPYLALISHLRALKAWSEAKALRSLLPAISMVKIPAMSCYTPQQSLTAIKDLISGFSIQPVHYGRDPAESGQPQNPNQWLFSVAFRQTNRSTPVGFAPIRIKHAHKNLFVKAVSDELGLVSAEDRSGRNQASISKDPLVILDMDSDQIFTQAGIQTEDPVFRGLAVEIGKIRYALRAPLHIDELPKVIIIVVENQPSESIIDGAISMLLSRQLKEQGISVYHPDNPQSFVMTYPRIESLLDAVKSQADILIYGRITMEKLSEIRDNLTMVRLEGTLQAIETYTGTRIGTYTKALTSVGMNPDNAKQRAFSTFSKLAFLSLIEPILNYQTPKTKS